MAQQVYQITTTTYGNLIDITFDGNTYEFSDHGRDPITVDTERIEMTRRTAKGTRRRYHIADKVSFSVSWTNLPADNTRTVDGKMGAEGLETMYNANLSTDEVQVSLADEDGGTTTYTMHIIGFSKTIAKRWKDGYLYDVTIDFEEV